MGIVTQLEHRGSLTTLGEIRAHRYAPAQPQGTAEFLGQPITVYISPEFYTELGEPQVLEVMVGPPSIEGVSR
jgi:hypothetical protein